MKRRLFSAGLVLGLAAASCKSEEAKKEEPADTAGAGGAGGPGSGPEERATVRDAAERVSANIAVVEKGMVPTSLAPDEGAFGLLTLNPCAGTGGFFDCQPNLLKLYVGLGRHMVGVTNALMSNVAGRLLQHVSLPASGAEQCGSLSNSNEEGGVRKVDYCVTSASVFRVLLHTEAGPFLYLGVDGDRYELMGDMANGPHDDREEEGGGGPRKIRALIEYVDEDNYDVTVEAVAAACRAEDLRAPETMVVKIGLVDGVHSGKSMLYHPRWLFRDGDGVSCETAPTDAIAMAYYTDFVGNDDHTSASIYFAPRTLEDVGGLADYEVADFCTNNPGHCSDDGRAFGESVSIAETYSNPFCVTALGTTWGGACASAVTQIAEPTFGPASRWMPPSELSVLGVTLPSSLEPAGGE